MKATHGSNPLRAGSRIGKYRILRRLYRGGYSSIYKAFDTIEGIRVALKIPHEHLMDERFLDDFRKEVRLTVNLDHPNILPIKNAAFIDDLFVIVSPLGVQTLADRLQKRLSLRLTLDFAEQALDALAHAHANKIIHCDIKPENFILFPENRLKLSDFGISRIAMRTVEGSGSGTVGFVAPEQAMGRPSLRSDVFSMGLILYRMLSGKLPAWPFTPPLPNYDKLRKRLHPDLIKLALRAMEVTPSKRYSDAGHMLNALRKIKSRVLAYTPSKRKRRINHRTTSEWPEVLFKYFLQNHGRIMETRYHCSKCHGPVSEAMTHCPWCGKSRKVFRDETRFPAVCPRCGRGVKKDWKYCPWCYGAGFDEVAARQYSDKRYQTQCHNKKCTRKKLMPFMRYCPWCRTKVSRPWKIPGGKDTCPSCHWGVLPALWSVCPWCGKKLAKK